MAPVAARRFRLAPPMKRRDATRLACEKAVFAAAFAAPEAREALAVLRGSASPDVSLRVRLERLAAALDDEYLRLSEAGGDERQVPPCFFSARAASALAFALAEDDAKLHEAIYESIAALPEPAELVHLIEEALA